MIKKNKARVELMNFLSMNYSVFVSSGALVVSSRIWSFNSYHELIECSAKLHVIKWIVMILDTDWSIQSC